MKGTCQEFEKSKNLIRTSLEMMKPNNPLHRGSEILDESSEESGFH